MSYVAFPGSHVEVVWGADARGRPHGKAYFEGLSKSVQNHIMATITILGTQGFVRDNTRVRQEGEGVSSIKTRQGNRLAGAGGFIPGAGQFVITHGFDKATDKMLQSERDRTHRLIKEHLARESQEAKKRQMKNRGEMK